MPPRKLMGHTTLARRAVEDDFVDAIQETLLVKPPLAPVC